ncbi:MAG: hypothetical protein IKY07_08445, partial [Clostridia bacterium]|nr:hypothetical protein [Clostridia bacterium]
MQNEIKEERGLPTSEHYEESEDSKEIAELLETDSEDREPAIETEHAQKPDYASEIIAKIRGNLAPRVLKDELESYHENDLADVLEQLSNAERRKIYRILDTD